MITRHYNLILRQSHSAKISFRNGLIMLRFFHTNRDFVITSNVIMRIHSAIYPLMNLPESI